MRTFLLLLCLLALPSWGATLSTTTCTSTVKTGCVVMDLSVLNQLPSTVGVQMSGTWTGTVRFEGSIDGSTYVSVVARPSSGGSWVSEATSVGVWAADVAGLKYFRARASVLSSGTITVDLVPSTARPVADVVRATGTDFGGVVLAVPDGGHQVSVGSATVNTAVLTPDGGLRVTLGTDTVAVASDGGLGVVVRGPLAPTTDGGVALLVSAPDVVRVVGPTFGAVEVSGTVDLSSATMFGLGSEVCEVGEARRYVLTTTPTILPPNLSDGGTGAMPNRTRWLIANIDGTKNVSCRKDPGDGGVPDCAAPGFGLTALANGGGYQVPVRQSDTMRCVACTNGATIEVTEEACVAP